MWLKYTIQPFARQFFDAVSSVQLPASNDLRGFSLETFMMTYLPYIIHSTLHKV
jgi:hypothetical protein